MNSEKCLVKKKGFNTNKEAFMHLYCPSPSLENLIYLLHFKRLSSRYGYCI